jgi:hypothetical protein
MAHYAHISNEQFTVADRARLEEARREKDVIETANRASDEYADLRETYENSPSTSETLEGLRSDLNALYPDIESEPAQEDIDDINDAIASEKAVLAAAKESALADMKAKEAEGTEALVTEMAALETSIANTPYIVTHVATGVDEMKYSPGDASAQNGQIFDLERSKEGVEDAAELQVIDDQIQALREEIENIPPIGTDNTLYWEGWYRHHGKVQAVRRTSYNTQGGVHKLGGTPFRKNYAGVGYMYDPVRDAFYAPQPYPSWTLNEDTCYWEAPTPIPEGMDFHWNEATLEWIDNPGVKPYASWIYNEDNEDWEAPVEYPNDGTFYGWNEETLTWFILGTSQPYPSWTWNTETKVWEAPTPKPNSDAFPPISYVWNEETLTWEEI